MADEKKNQPESQKQRWLKYGSNVAVASIVVIALAVLVTYLAQSARKRVDTTRSGQYSLKPQTKEIVKELKQPIRLISLYSAPTADDYKARSGTESDADRRVREQAAEEKQWRYEAVNDMVQEYARASDKIKAEAIDPLADPAKVDMLVAQLTETYGGEVKKYRDFIDTYREKTFPEIKNLAAQEAAAVAKVTVPENSEDEQLQAIDGAKFTVVQFPKVLEQINTLIKRPLEQKPPDYKGAVDAIQSGTSQFDAFLGQIIAAFNSAKTSEKLPADVKAYINESLPRYEAIKKLTTSVLDQVKGLGELKLDKLRESLRARDSILVLGDSDLKVLTSDQVWQNDVDRQAMGAGRQVVKPKFAGEQQITTAILSLTQKPRKIAFVRPSGPPVAESGIPGFQRGGMLGAIADRLRSYNFEVIEKDLSGMSAMQAQMQGQPAPEEPSDEELKDAIWVVVNLPSQQQNPMMGAMSPTIAPKIMEHLNAGGSALVMTLPNADKLDEAFADWGVQMATDQIIVHEAAGADSVRSTDMIEEAKKIPYIFALNEFGDHLLAKPIRGLDAIMVPIIPVRTQSKPGVTATPLLPIPQQPKAWAETDMSSVSRPGVTPNFDEKTGDIAGPLFGGAALEREGKGRLVVIGSLQFATDGLISIPDEEMLQRGVFVARFPANAELVTNSIFWLAKMEPMIAISPAAMEVSRIGPISPGLLTFWRVGVLLVGLPALVVLAGVGVYVSRKN